MYTHTHTHTLLNSFSESLVNENTFGRPNWFDNVREEHLTCRKSVAMFDLTSFSKFEIEVGAHPSLLKNSFFCPVSVLECLAKYQKPELTQERQHFLLAGINPRL